MESKRDEPAVGRLPERSNCKGPSGPPCAVTPLRDMAADYREQLPAWNLASRQATKNRQNPLFRSVGTARKRPRPIPRRKYSFRLEHRPATTLFAAVYVTQVQVPVRLVLQKSYNAFSPSLIL